MELYERIAIFVMIFTGLSVAVDPDWSCYFEEDDCGVIEVEGNWYRIPDNEGQLKSNFTERSTGEMAIFSIPYNFTSPQGNLSFEYLIAGINSVLTVNICKKLNKPIFEVHGVGSPERETVVLRYSCANIMDVEIKFIATRGSIAPKILVDDILIYEVPYTEPSTTVSVDPTIKARQTESSNTNSPTEARSPTSSRGQSTIFIEVSATTALAKRLSWIIPVAIILGVVILVISIVLYRYRRRKQQSNPSENMALQNRHLATISGDSEVRYSNQTTKQTSDIGYDATKGRFVHQDDNQGRDLSAAANFEVENTNDSKASNLLKNPVYESSIPIPTRVKHGDGARIESMVGIPLYKEALDNQPQSAQEDERHSGQALNRQPGSAPTEALLDNPLYGDGGDRSKGHGFNSQTESAEPDSLVDNPLYGGQSDKFDGPGFNGQSEFALTDDLVDNPLYDDGGDRSNGSRFDNQQEPAPSDGLLDNPLYGGSESAPTDEF